MVENSEHDWASVMSSWAYAHGQPSASGRIKVLPEDFQVIENMPIEPEGEGEHVWLQLTKQRQNTETVAKALARYANVNYRDVGYSGLKDFNAVTQQWFSIHQTKNKPIDWQAFEFAGVQIDQYRRHSRKIKRGTHKSNLFVIKVRDYVGDVSELENRVQLIQQQGVPNYFGEQRFGRDINNMHKATSLLVNGQTYKDKHLRGILYSSARSWLFNCIVSQRISEDSWTRLYEGEPVNLDGTNSVFKATNGHDEQNRLTEMDIHPTAPLWGKYKKEGVEEYSELHQNEQSVLASYKGLCAGLERSGLNYQRRATRMRVNELCYQHQDDGIEFSFSLRKGQFATSVIRELFQLV